MSFFFFYKNHKPRKFEHKPIFYDSRKENLDKRIEMIHKEMDSESCENSPKPRLKEHFIQGTFHLKKKKIYHKSSFSVIFGNALFFLIILMLVMLGWYLFLK